MRGGIFKVFAAVCVGMLIGLGTANSATYYLSPSGSDGAAGTSEGTAWATFSKALQSLYPGDTLIVLDGTYYDSIRMGMIREEWEAKRYM